MSATFILSNNSTLPAVGLGTFQGDTNNARVKDVVLTALRYGYRHIDTAAAYGNEKVIGLAIRESQVPRQELFITTKLSDNALSFLVSRHAER